MGGIPRAYAMKRLLMLISLLSIATLSPTALAGLGSAESGTKRDFDAYCGEKGNNCKITFTQTHLIIDGKDKIHKDMIRKVVTEECFRCLDGRRSGCISHVCNEGSALIIYKEGGVEGSGVIMFVNAKAWDQFKRALSGFCGADCRPQGPSIKIES